MFSSVQRFFLPGGPEEDGLLFPFSRYVPGYYRRSGKTQQSASLVFLHSVGTPVETWLPTIEEICRRDYSSGRDPIIGEIWLAELPTHGHGAVVNEERLLQRPQGVSVAGWARGIHVLLRSNLMMPGSNVVGVGHSAGACSLSMSTIGTLNNVPYSSLILIDPPIQPKFTEIVSRPFVPPAQLEMIRKAAKVRKDVWSSRESARAWFATRAPWKIWDPKVLDLHLEYGLRELPTRTYPDKEGVTLTLTRDQEYAGFLYPDEAIESMHWLARLGTKIPIHCIFAGREVDATTFPVRKPVGKRAIIASISKVNDAGHLIVQEKPRELADAIWGVLASMEMSVTVEQTLQFHSKL